MDEAAAIENAWGASPRNAKESSALYRTLDAFSTALLGRMDFARRVGQTFYDGVSRMWKRDIYGTLGYERTLNIVHYRARYERGDIAERIVEAYPLATWASGAYLTEDPNPEVSTDFESASTKLFDRLSLWSVLTQADILSGLGRYSIVLIGTRKGSLESPLPDKLTADDVIFLKPVAEDRAVIAERDWDQTSPRFGLPTFYNVNLSDTDAAGIAHNTAYLPPVTFRAHWSRVLHIADGKLDSNMFGKPRLRAVWNRLDDLEKIVGGGAEAAWKRMDPGMQVDIDPEYVLKPGEKEKVQQQVDEYQHGSRRVLQTRGAKVNLLTTSVAGFGPNAQSVVQLISGTTGIPYRILMGTESGELSSSQDRLNWRDRVNERRLLFAAPVIFEFVNRLIEKGALPKPSGKQYASGYSISWPPVGRVDEKTQADIVSKVAAANQTSQQSGAGIVMTPNEMRNVYLDLPNLRPEQQPPPPVATTPGNNTPKPPKPAGESGDESRN